MRRKPRFYLFTICAPMFLFSVISFAQYVLPLTEFIADRLSFSLVTVLTTASYKLTTGQLVPPVHYVTHIDAYVLSTITIVSLHAIAMPVSHQSVDPQFYDMASLVFTFSAFLLLNAWFGYLVVHNAQAPIEVERIRRAAKRDSRDVRDAEQISKIHARAALIRKKQAMTLCSTAAVQPSAATASMTETASEMMQTYMSRSRAVLV